ncbi:hypothetical protein AB0M61_09300 [Streptomyces sp. NPDC051642]|uniref:hypothetical protein n=1 Tax=unclassified Streptomyces TaxID=2593676 RepID=UPI00342F0847
MSVVHHPAVGNLVADELVSASRLGLPVFPPHLLDLCRLAGSVLAPLGNHSLRLLAGGEGQASAAKVSEVDS